MGSDKAKKIRGHLRAFLHDALSLRVDDLNFEGCRVRITEKFNEWRWQPVSRELLEALYGFDLSRGRVDGAPCPP